MTKEEFRSRVKGLPKEALEQLLMEILETVEELETSYPKAGPVYYSGFCEKTEPFQISSGSLPIMLCRGLAKNRKDQDTHLIISSNYEVEIIKDYASSGSDPVDQYDAIRFRRKGT
jgi:hypothetical protein